MKSSTFAALRELGAPLAPLERVKIHRVASRTGKVWHRDRAAYPPLHFDKMCCARSEAFQGERSARRLTVSVADAYRDDLQLCRETGCGLPYPVASYTDSLVSAHRAIGLFDAAAEHGEWVVARQYAAMLERAGTLGANGFVGDEVFSAQEYEALAEWVRAQHRPRRAAVDTALTDYGPFINRAFAAWMVPVDPDAITECGADPAYVPIARANWQEAVESLDTDETVRAEVAAALATAAERLGENPPDPGPYFDLCDRWWSHADRIAEHFERSPKVVLVGSKASAPLARGALTGSAHSYRVLAAHLHPTVHHNGATASLVPVEVAQRVRSQIAQTAKQDGQLRRVAVVELAPGADFDKVAITALSLWDQTADSWSSPLATPEGAWAAAEATHHSPSR